jgi:DNA repair exonuclease SbcCD ATPase subunit
MKITKVELVNFCQHSHTLVEFSPGLNGIFGDNGAGKSNLLRGMSYALTGVSPNHGEKKDDLKLGESKGYARVDFIAHGVSGTIKRHLASSACTLNYGNEKFTTASSVNENIFRILGVSKDMLQRTIFVHQEDLDKILFERPAERSKALQRLFGTWRAEELRELLYSEISDMPDVSYANRMKEIDEEHKLLETGRLVELNKEIVELKEQLSRIPEAELNSSLHNHTEAVKLRQSLQNYDDANYTRARERYLSDITSANNLVEQLRQRVEAAEPDILKLSKERDVLVSMLNKFTRRQKLVEMSGELEEQLLSTDSPTPPSTEKGKLDMYRKELERLSNEIEIHTRFLDAIKASNKCFYCNSVIQDMESRVNDAKAIIDSARTKYEQLSTEERELRAQWTEYEKEIAEHAQRSVMLVRRAKEVSAELRELGQVRSVAPADIELVEQQLIQLRRVLPDQLNNAIYQREKLREELHALDEKHKEKAGAAAEFKRIQSHILSEDAYRNIYGQLNTASELRRKIAESQGAIHEANRRLEALEAKLNELRERENEYNSTRAFFELVSSARAVLHRDDLPKKTAQAFQEVLNVKLNEYLSVFAASFTCRMGDDLEFICEFPDGELAAERLSGGQRVMLAISFRFAVNDIFSNQLGLLVMDEPTRWLNDKSIGKLIAVLEAAKSVAKSGALQLILISHNEQLFEVCDNIIRI